MSWHRVLLVYRDLEEIAPYQQSLIAAGIDAVMADVSGPLTVDGCGGVVLTGGNDVDPAIYGEQRGPHTEEPDVRRDAVESAILRQALDRDLAVLAICRGLQLMNVVHGGDLIQHLDSVSRHCAAGPVKGAPAHRIQVETGTLLHSITGASEWYVNSRHHQSVKTVGRGLRVSAFDPEDGTIEALERPDKRFVLAVQWHPENQALLDPKHMNIFKRFGEAVG